MEAGVEAGVEERGERGGGGGGRKRRGEEGRKDEGRGRGGRYVGTVLVLCICMV